MCFPENNEQVVFAVEFQYVLVRWEISVWVGIFQLVNMRHCSKVLSTVWETDNKMAWRGEWVHMQSPIPLQLELLQAFCLFSETL